MIKELTLRLKRVKAQFRAMAEDSFHALKNIFRHRKTPHRGLAKNTAQLYIFFALAKLFFARRTLRNPRQTMNGRQTHAKLMVPAENHPSVGLQIVYFARKSQRSLQSLLKMIYANHPVVPRLPYSAILNRKDK